MHCSVRLVQPYQLITGTPLCGLHRDLDQGRISHEDAGDRVKAVLGEDQELHVHGAAWNPLTRGQHAEELTPCVTQSQISACPAGTLSDFAPYTARNHVVTVLDCSSGLSCGDHDVWRLFWSLSSTWDLDMGAHAMLEGRLILQYMLA